MTRTMTFLTTAALLVSGTLAMAQMHSGHSGHSIHGAAPGAASAQNASTAAFKAANERMHKAMDIPFTGDADADFVKGMIPHHQGAVEMAKIVLQFGKDPELRKLAEEIIAAQEKEIAFMTGWLKKNGK